MILHLQLKWIYMDYNEVVNHLTSKASKFPKDYGHQLKFRVHFFL